MPPEEDFFFPDLMAALEASLAAVKDDSGGDADGVGAGKKKSSSGGKKSRSKEKASA